LAIDDLKLEKELTSVDLKTWENAQIDLDMSWKVPNKYDVDIWAGAHYNNKWGRL